MDECRQISFLDCVNNGTELIVYGILFIVCACACIFCEMRCTRHAKMAGKDVVEATTLSRRYFYFASMFIVFASFILANLGWELYIIFQDWYRLKDVYYCN